MGRGLAGAEKQRRVVEGLLEPIGDDALQGQRLGDEGAAWEPWAPPALRRDVSPSSPHPLSVHHFPARGVGAGGARRQDGAEIICY